MQKDIISYADLNDKPLESKLREDVERTEKSAWLKVFFLQNMSHELRNPLTAICGFADLLADIHSQDGDKETLTLVNKIASNSHQLLDKLGNLLSTTREECLTRQKQETESTFKLIPDNASVEELFKALDKARQHESERTAQINDICGDVHIHIDTIVDLAHRLVKAPSELVSPDDIKAMIQLIEENSHVLLTLVDDIRDWGMLQSGIYRTRCTSISPNHICKICLESVKHNVSSGVKLRFESSLPDDMLIYTDNVRLQQVIRNLLSNAIKYTSEGSITLACRLVDEGVHVEFSVTDTGTGIDPANAEVIFHRFEKLDSFKKGSGLGLYICRMVAARLGGEIHLDTSYSGGSRFVFTHPLKAE
ncbi:MAG: hypothetical protein J5486_09470 [Bacteroidaceae bacterium]|nr:hypothetical protein [Bacteroidaceae bacterium]